MDSCFLFVSLSLSCFLSPTFNYATFSHSFLFALVSSPDFKQAVVSPSAPFGSVSSCVCNFFLLSQISFPPEVCFWRCSARRIVSSDVSASTFTHHQTNQSKTRKGHSSSPSSSSCWFGELLPRPLCKLSKQGTLYLYFCSFFHKCFTVFIKSLVYLLVCTFLPQRS